MGAAPYLYGVDSIKTIGEEARRLAERTEITVARVFADPLSDGRLASLELAQTLVASPYFTTMQDAVAVFRAGSGLAVMGKLSQEDADRLGEFENETFAAQARIKVFTYEDVEELVTSLSTRIRQELGDAVADASFVAIPRGGAIVLGILSYLLDLRPDQLTRTLEPTGPTVVVDDCSLSGLRFQETLRDLPGSAPVIFAPLLSPRELRERLLLREPRVPAVISAMDIEDRAPSILGRDYEGWLARWSDRDVGGYWAGIPEHIVFPWSEPDTAIWDPVSGTTVCGWRAASPKDCLKNRVAFQKEAHRLVVCAPNERGAFAPAPHVVYADLKDGFVVANLRTSNVWEFEGAAGVFWNALTMHETSDLAAEALSGEFDLTAAELKEELHEFATEATKLGILTPGP